MFQKDGVPSSRRVSQVSVGLILLPATAIVMLVLPAVISLPPQQAPGLDVTALRRLRGRVRVIVKRQSFSKRKKMNDRRLPLRTEVVCGQTEVPQERRYLSIHGLLVHWVGMNKMRAHLAL